MDRQRWQRIEEIYERALERPPEERDAVIDAECAGDVELRREVASLLASNDAAGDFLSPGEFSEQLSSLTAEPARALVGRTLGKYDIVAEIGAGSMGEVYRARDSVLNRQVALKLLPRQFTTDPERIARLVREAKAASALNHPNIFTIYEVGEADGRWFIAAEFVEGESLRQRLAGGPLPLSDALDLMLQCCAAVEVAHRAGIIHRDLKPENVMVRPDGVVKVVDFGLARVIGSQVGASLPGVTQDGQVMGTPRYMSPEQARGESVDARTDVFSLTAMLFEMAAGRPLLGGATTPEVFAELLKADLTPQFEALASQPRSRDLVRIVARGLHKDRDARYASVQSLGRELAALRTMLQTDGGKRWLPQLFRFPRWRFAAVVLILAAAVVLTMRADLFRRVADPPAPRIASLAVLPFINLSSDPEREYLVDGMTDQLITDLARLTPLRVISRTSVMRYKGRSQPVPEVARALDVDAIVEGSVREADGRVFVTAQLLHAGQDRRLWAHNYDRTDADLLALTGEIARDVERELFGASGVGRSPQRQERLVSRDAYDDYLRGRHAWNKRTPDGYRQALDHFNAAVDKDPGYAEAYAGLADTYLLMGEYLIWPAEDAFPRARAAAARAIAIDPTLAPPYAALAQINANEWRWADADREFQRAVDHDPGYATGRQWRAEYLAISGRPDEALAEIRQAHALDPLSLIINTQLGWILMIARQPDAAVAQLRRTIEMDPRFVQAHTNLGIAYDAGGDHAAALAAFKQAADIGGGADPRLWMARELAHLGRAAEARATLTRLLPIAQKGEAGASTVALVFLALGEVDSALSWMKQGCSRRSVGPANYPPFDPIRTDPRFVAIMRCMELPSR